MKNYDDIIDLPHHTSSHHARMPQKSRAAQFAPFAAMVGHDSAIAEVERLTEKKVELDENAIEELDEKLRYLSFFSSEAPELTVTYFKPDERKSGGAYISAKGKFLALDENDKILILSDGLKIKINDIRDIESDLFSEF